MPKKQDLDPLKWSSHQGKTLGCEKACLKKENPKSKKNIKKNVAGIARQHCFLQCFRRILLLKKSALLGFIWTLPNPKIELLCERGDDFRGFDFESSKNVKNLPHSAGGDQDGLGLTHLHPHTHTLKRICVSQTSKITKVIVVGHKILKRGFKPACDGNSKPYKTLKRGFKPACDEAFTMRLSMSS